MIQMTEESDHEETYFANIVWEQWEGANNSYAEAAQEVQGIMLMWAGVWLFSSQWLSEYQSSTADSGAVWATVGTSIRAQLM